MSRVIYANTPSTLDQQTLREAHDVRLVTDGRGRDGRQRAARRRVRLHLLARRCPNAPLFATRRFRSYETHKLADGEVFVIGFADVERPQRALDVEQRRA